MIITLAVGIGVLVLLGGSLFFLLSALKKRHLRESLEYSLFLVRLPKSPRKESGIAEEIALFENFLANLTSFKKPVSFEIAVPHVGEEIHFYISLPDAYREAAIRQLQGIWNGASVEEVREDYNVFNSNGFSVAGYFSEKESYALPFRSYKTIGSDPVSSIIGGFSKIKELGEGAALQMIVRPAEDWAKKNIRSYIEALRKGSKLGDALSHSGIKPEEGAPVDEAGIKALSLKAEKPLFEVNLRVCASAPNQFAAESVLDGIVAGFDQFSAPETNSLKFNRAKNPNSLIYRYVFRDFENSEKLILNSEEIASIYHFPISTTDTPRVKWLKSKEAAPPADLPAEGTLIGESVFRGEKKQIRITDEDRRRHVYVIGQTGTGKSTLLLNSIVEDIEKGKGVAVIDPHGELVEDAMTRIPASRRDDLVYFNPGDLSRPLGLNMLDFNIDRPEEKTFIVNEMQSIFNKLFSQETMGPMFEQYMRNALLLLMEDMAFEPATLVEVPRIFTDPEFRKRKLARINNPVVKDFWEKEAAKAGGEASLANMTPYITSKFNNFISNDYMRPIIGQAKSAFNFREVMDSGKILFVNLSKGKIGDINANLLGMVITGKILMAALSRADIAGKERRDFNLYIDEFQNFTTDSISTILSEARKYRLNLMVAHQFIAQLTEKIRDSIFGNVGTQIVYRVGAQDAEFLKKQFEPIFDENDLMNIDNFNSFVRLLINGEPAKPFNMKAFPFRRGDQMEADKLKELSRSKYGMERSLIEQEIYSRLRSNELSV